MKRWQGSCLGAFLALVVGGGLMLFMVPFGGAMIAGIPPLFDRLTAYTLCPDAVDYAYNDYGFGQPTTSSPNSGTGHYTELTCTYADGSEETHPNQEVGLKGLAAAGVASAACNGLAVLVFMILAAIIGARLVKPRNTV